MLPVISEWNFEAIVRIAKRDILNQSDRKSAGVRTSTLLIRIRFHRKVAIFRRNRATWVDTWLWIKNHRSWLEIENTGLHSYVTFLNRSLVRNAMSQRKGRRRGQLNQNARSVLTSAYHDTIFHFLFFLFLSRWQTDNVVNDMYQEHVSRMYMQVTLWLVSE